MRSSWLAVGDFNDYTSLEERRNFFQNQNVGGINNFVDRINRCNLMDLGCERPKLTWTNNRQGLANVKERLDRALYNTEWRTNFLEESIRNLPCTYSDHSPMLVFIDDLFKHEDVSNLNNWNNIAINAFTEEDNHEILKPITDGDI
ncbi:uncharacterized protein LOC114273695 [Camellia sinensis]|uniref:uncharacterized protein LOC114273695 n=1 Tax=Camellia sinensis TaxID=4442 RepID=UPI0010357054|nr:uncharacterized protein LOC114273695 [Camellia sinensis]